MGSRFYLQQNKFLLAQLRSCKDGREVGFPLFLFVQHAHRKRVSFFGDKNAENLIKKLLKIGRHTLGDHVFNEYVAMKKNEWDSYRTAVHAWEIEHYQTKF